MPVWILTALLIGLAGNLDNLGVGVAYGARRIGVPASSNLLIALVAALGSAVLGYAGSGLGHALNPAAASVIRCIIAVGLWMLWPRPAQNPSNWSFTRRRRTRASPETSRSAALMLSVGLGINTWAGGFSGGLVGVPAWALALATGGLKLRDAVVRRVAPQANSGPVARDSGERRCRHPADPRWSQERHLGRRSGAVVRL